MEGIAEVGSNSGWIATDSYVDVLETWPCINIYMVTDQFTFERQGDCYIRAGCDPLKTKIELPVMIWKGGDYSPAIIKAGTTVYPTSTDGKTYMKFALKDYFEPRDYVEGMIDLTASGSGYSIDGVSEYDCFETVPYAG